MKKATISTEKKRNVNIEIFRIVSMLMIVMLHNLKYGGALTESEAYSFTYILSWILEAFCIFAVNGYVLVSGYFLVKTEFKIKKVITIWAQVLFFSILISLALWGAGFVKFSVKDAAFTFLPVLTSKYWFATTYIGLYFLFPFLNIAMNAMSKKQMKYLIFTLVAIFSVWKTVIPFAKTLDPTGGYSIIWFICLYFIAGYIRLHYQANHSPYKYLLIYLCTTCLIILSKFVIVFVSPKIGLTADLSSYFYDYNSIAVLASSVSLFLFVSKMKERNNAYSNIILKVSGATFGVYLIHEHFLLRPILWNNLSSKNFASAFYFIKTIGLVFAVYVVCTIIELVRQTAFSRLENGKLVQKISDKISPKYSIY